MFEWIAGLVIGAIAGVFGLAVFRSRSKAPPESSVCSQQLESLSRLTGELAHEIKNPLSTIKINLRLASEQLQRAFDRDKDNDQVGQALRKVGVVRKETDRVEQILEDFLQYIKNPELQLESTDLNEHVGEVIDFFMPHAHTHRITLRSRLHSEPLICRIDSDMIKQVLLNLFLNAQEVMAEGGELIVETGKQGDGVFIRVSDTGCGIAPADLERIFEPYYSSKQGGSGLGLATAERIVEAHHGRIRVDSAPGKGSAFTIELPPEPSK